MYVLLYNTGFIKTLLYVWLATGVPNPITLILTDVPSGLVTINSSPLPICGAAVTKLTWLLENDVFNII